MSRRVGILLLGSDWLRVECLGSLAQADVLRCCIESTGAYHMPVLLAWKAIPCVVNPLLAGPTRRKTDVLDARMLAHHSITGIWKPSFIPTESAQVLRVLWAARGEAVRAATRAQRRGRAGLRRFELFRETLFPKLIAAELNYSRVPSR